MTPDTAEPQEKRIQAAIEDWKGRALKAEAAICGAMKISDLWEPSNEPEFVDESQALAVMKESFENALRHAEEINNVTEEAGHSLYQNCMETRTMLLPHEVGAQYWMRDDYGDIALWEVTEIVNRRALLRPVLILACDEPMPSQFQGLPIYCGLATNG